MARNHIELSSQAQRDLRRLGPGKIRDRIIQVLEDELAAVPQPEALDIRPLAGAAPWLRLRVGEFRVIYRLLTDDELRALAERTSELEGQRGFLVQRIINRRDLDRAVATLP